MIRKTTIRIGLSAGLAAVVCLVGGCRGGKGKDLGDQMPSQAHIGKIVKLYTAYGQSRNKLPDNVQQLKDFAKKLKKDDLTAMGIDDVDDAFISPNDKEPYGLIKPGDHMMGMARVLAYEKTGVGGIRFTVSSQGTVFKMNEADFKQAVPNP